MAKRTRKNPPVPIDDAYDAFQRARRNPPKTFAEFLVENNVDPASYTDAQWDEMLAAQGMNDDEAASYLEDMAEWRLP